MSAACIVSTPKSFEQVAAEIQPLVRKFRRAGAHKATFLCPAHDDKNPSAWIAINENGWTHAHCSVCGNLRQTFNGMGVFFSESNGFHKRKTARQSSYLETLRAKKENREFSKAQLEALYWGEPGVSLTYHVYPVDGALLEQRIAHARENPPLESPFSEPLTADGIERTHAIVLRYLQESRGLKGPFHGLLFSHTSLDTRLGTEKRDGLEKDVKAVLITPLRNPSKYDERAWQETWLDGDGRKIERHYPAGVPQAGRVFYRKATNARILVVGEGLESAWSAAEKFEPADVIAAMSLNQFAHLEITRRYDRIVLCPDLEPHGRGLQAVLNLAARWMPTNPAQLCLLRPDGKGPFDPVESKMDMNDLSPEQREQMRPVVLDVDNLLHPAHPMRHWSSEPIGEIYQKVASALEEKVNAPGTGRKSIIAVGTGVGKSHALATAVAQAKESVLACAPTREGRASLARNLDPDTQEHHGRSEFLTPEQIVEHPERYCKVYFGLKGEAPPEGPVYHVVTEDMLTPAAAGELGFPISQICNTQCPRGQETLFQLTGGKKGANTGAPICPHILKRMEHWYQEPRLTGTHAALNGDPTLFQVDGKLRSHIVLDEAPDLLRWSRVNIEKLHELKTGIFYNFRTDQHFYTEPDREERLEAYQNITSWTSHLESLLMSGWKNGDLPPLPGKTWDEFHHLVKNFPNAGHVTTFERAYVIPGQTGKHYGPVLLAYLSKAIESRTLFWEAGSAVAITRPNIGEALLHKSRKQDITILTATPSRALRHLCDNDVMEYYPATPNLYIEQIRGNNWSKTALSHRFDDTIQDAIDIVEILPENSAVLTTKAYADHLECLDASGVTIGYWGRDHEGHNRYQDCTHLEILGLQMLPRHTYWMMYEATRRLYNLPWQPADEDTPWIPQSMDIPYLPNSWTSFELPDNPDYAYYVREHHTTQLAQAVGRLRAARRLDEKLTVTIRTNFPFLPLYGLVIQAVDGDSNRQRQVHDRAVEKVKSIVQLATEQGLRPTYRQVCALSKEQFGKGVRYKNWKEVVDTLGKDNSSQGVNIDIEELWKLTSAAAIRAEARRRGDLMRHKEAAIPGRGDGPDGEALIDTIRVMDRYHCDSGEAARRILEELDKNRYHPGEYVQFLEEIVANPIPKNGWTEDAACHVA